MTTVEGEVWGGDGVGAEWSSPYEVLRKKWGTVPLDAETCIESGELLTMPDRDLLAL